jgi:hypothetical protein
MIIAARPDTTDKVDDLLSPDRSPTTDSSEFEQPPRTSRARRGPATIRMVRQDRLGGLLHEYLRCHMR